MTHGQDDRIGLLMNGVQQALAQYRATELRLELELLARAPHGCDSQALREWAAAMLRLSRTLDAAAVAASCEWASARPFVGTIVP